MSTFSLVIPFYNEEKNAKRVVEGLTGSFEKAAIDYELILVDNGSVDATPRILEELAGAKPAAIKVVHVPVNQGYGWGIINGMKAATGEYAGHMCGDGQVTPADVLKLFEFIKKEKCDLCKVRRVARHDGFVRKVLSVGYNTLFLLIFNVKTMDVNGTPKIVRRTYLEKMAPQSRDWFIDAEIMIKARHLDLKVSEVPVEFLRREAGRSHVAFSTIWEFARNMSSYKLGRGMRQWKQSMLKS
ncbi:MAG: glycosyltransferase family 2 protein [Dehalococcoidales bacterium]|nr:glycosyltransferase family 2 protein [Dehalococcoidales bacterium]